ncbi:beta-galactosidase [Bacillus sp. (in: firmicutes)]|uniref:beta-galactosidase n=1 Tax=Bacillus sp. TaxID=1409 RepID=UPI0023F4A3B6|nr:beta-galactosidase [Bacillus sp. (in: firmicutes)]
MKRKLYHGACYYPELWDEETIRQDIDIMREVGVNVVRIGEFAWSVMEPEEGEIDVGFFKEIITRLYNNGIETIMCTPTPTPPIWLSHGRPDRMHVNEKREVMGHGSRQHACTNNPYFRKRAAIITSNIAKELGKLPGLIGWQLDNEFKCHVAECMCETCMHLWHDWLKGRYGVIERLNEAWGTDVWSETYQTFEQVPPPGPAPFLHHASLSTMYQLFSMEMIAQFADEQAKIIRCYSDAPITHNGSVMFSVDNERMFRNLDFASYDTYASQENASAFLLNCDLWRNLKQGRPFWILETSPSYAASLESSAFPHADGYLQAEAVSSYALGSEGFCYWLWRQQRSGSEISHGSVLSAWGEPAVGYQNVLAVERARKEIESVILSTEPVQAEAAMTYSDRAKAYIKTEPHRGLRHRSLVTHFYERILNTGIHRDLIPEGAPLDGYRLLFTPFLPYLSSEFINKASAFAEAGGIWIAGPLTGGRTSEHTIHTDCGLGELEKTSGIKTLFTFPMNEDVNTGKAFGITAPLGLWSAVFDTGSGNILGTVESGPGAGHAFLTEQKHGKGKIVMLGSLPSGKEGDAMLEALVRHYAAEAAISIRSDVTPGTIVAPRKGDNGLVWIIVNMDGKGGSVTLPEAGTDLLTNRSAIAGRLAVGPHEYRVIQFEHHS